MSFLVASDNYTLHVVGKNGFWNTQVSKRMKHANKKILLFGIWEEFNKSLSTMMTDHSKTGDSDRNILICINFYKTPVHLIGLSGIGCISAAAIPLRGN